MRKFCLAVILPFIFSVVHGEPSKAYLKCQRMLDGVASSHRQDADRLASKFNIRLSSLAAKHATQRSVTGTSPEKMATVVRRILERGHLDEAREENVEGVISSSSTVVAPDDEHFKCRDLDILRFTYEVKLETYEEYLETLMEEVADRYSIEQLEPGDGLVAIAFNSNVEADIVRINRRGSLLGWHTFGPVRPGEYFRVVKMRAGTYNWDEITKRFEWSKRIFVFSKRDSSFTVEAGKLNYAGVFLFEVAAGGYFTSSLNDRQTIVITILDQRYPELLEQYEIVNAIHPDDRFIQYYLQQKSIVNSGTSNEL